MAQQIIDLSGQAGLGNNTQGDWEFDFPQVNLKTRLKEGELADGNFNPYLREGYLAPAVKSATSISYSTAPTNVVASSQFDYVTGRGYFAELGTSLYEIADLSLTTLTRIHVMDTGFKIQDLEAYEIDGLRKLFVVGTLPEAVLETSLSNTTRWASFGLRFVPAGTTNPVVVSKEYITLNIPTSVNITVPDEPNTSIIVVAVVPEADTVSGTVGADAMSLYGTSLEFWSDEAAKRKAIVLYRNGVTSGDKTISLSGSTSFTGLLVFAVSNINQTVPVDDFVKNMGYTNRAISFVPAEDYSSYFQFVFGMPFREVSSLSSQQSFDPAAQLTNARHVFLNDIGTKMWVGGMTSSQVMTFYRYSLSTAFDVTTATYDTSTTTIDFLVSTINAGASFFNDGQYFIFGRQSPSRVTVYSLPTPYSFSGATSVGAIDLTDYTVITGVVMSNDGTKMIVSGGKANDAKFYKLVEYDLATPYDPSTAVEVDSLFIEDITDGIVVDQDNTTMYLLDGSTDTLYQYRFNPRHPFGLRYAARDSVSSVFSNGQSLLGFTSPLSQYVFVVDGGDNKVYRYTLASVSKPSLSPQQTDLATDNELTQPRAVSFSYTAYDNRIVDINLVSLPDSDNIEENWLTKTQSQFVSSNAPYNFMRSADNGFSYLFTGNRIHKIDGSTIGGSTGSFTKDVLLFPDYFVTTDAVDYRSKLYIAVRQHTVAASEVDYNRVGRTGIFVWNRISTQFNNTDYIDLPGVRDIKKIYVSPDQVLKLIVVSESGRTEVREFGYNDSGGVVFRTIKILGRRAYPSYPDSCTSAGDKFLWLASDGWVYCERSGSVTKLYKESSTEEDGSYEWTPLTSGAVMFGGTTVNLTAPVHDYPANLYINYRTSAPANTVKRIAPFSSWLSSGVRNSGEVGNVYTGVSYLPIGSVLRNIRIYNAPTSSSGTNTVATIKIYFNQGTTASLPGGMTKTITRNEAKRGYVDLKVNNPNVHSFQIEVEWPDDVSFDNDLYLPSLAVVTHDETSHQSPDGE